MKESTDHIDSKTMESPTLLNQLEIKKEIVEIDLAVRNYLADHPPSLGHGYSHLKKTARLAFGLAVANDQNLAEVAYVAGLLHDLYRPALGQAGQEDHQTKSARAAGQLLAQSAFVSEKEQIVAAITDYDQAILTGQATLLQKILSTADKAEMSFQRAVAYSWACNRHLKGEGSAAYTSFMETMRDFCQYQVKAWKVFLAVDIEGQKQAVGAYLETNESLIQAVRAEVEEENYYPRESEKLAKKEAELELKFLKEVGTSAETIAKITSNR